MLSALARRLTNQEIAEHYTLSKRTVEGYMSSLYRKFGVRTRRQLVAIGEKRTAGEATSGGEAAVRQRQPWAAAQWVAATIEQTQRRIDDAADHIERATAQSERVRAREIRPARHSRPSPAVPPGPRSARSQAAFEHAVRRERAAIVTHETSARRLDEMAAELEAASILDRDDCVRQHALDVAARARTRAADARERADVVRRRLAREGVADVE